jgi:Putative adhesin
MVATMWRRALAGLLSVFVFLTGGSGVARAQQALLPSTGSPFIVVQLESGSVTIHSWSRPNVGIDADPTVSYNHAPPRTVQGQMRQSVMLWSQTIQTQQGQLTLPPEPFPLPPVAPGDHDAYIIRGYGDVTLNVPYATPLVIVNVKIGSVDIAGFHGTFVVHSGAGQVHLDGDSGTGAVQVNNGAFFADESSFDRLRLRTGRGNVIMTNCRAEQIDVTTLLGSIVFDNGTFANGIARFESDRGAIAIGVNGGAQIEAHSGNGRIISDPGDVDIQLNGPDAQAQINGGGPVVTATSADGAIVIYTGSLRDHPNLQREIPPRLRLF